jgi:hypothetical protein
MKSKFSEKMGSHVILFLKKIVSILCYEEQK